jgi:hypothetical protein
MGNAAVGLTVFVIGVLLLFLVATGRVAAMLGVVTAPVSGPQVITVSGQ